MLQFAYLMPCGAWEQLPRDHLLGRIPKNAGGTYPGALGDAQREGIGTRRKGD